MLLAGTQKGQVPILWESPFATLRHILWEPASTAQDELSEYYPGIRVKKSRSLAFRGNLCELINYKQLMELSTADMEGFVSTSTPMVT